MFKNAPYKKRIFAPHIFKNDNYQPNDDIEILP